MPTSYAEALEMAIRAAQAAGAMLRAEFHRPDGPRGEGGHAPIDEEAEAGIRERLTSTFPDWGYLGEETASRDARGGPGPIYCWLVDPNDGTRAFVRGFRGSAVSIALLQDGLPVLGVVYAFSAPDDDGDLFAWAEGCGPITRNGRSLEPRVWQHTLGPETAVLVSHQADRHTAVNLQCVAPGRFWKRPSIAYRLALVAAGEAEAAVSLNGPGDWDYAAGHALLRGAGGAFVDQDGRPVVYSPDGRSRTLYCFGGAPGIVAELWQRPWPGALARRSSGDEPPLEFDLVRLERGRTVAEPGVLRRAQGCLLGQLAGDALGSLVEFQSAKEVRQAHPEGVHRLANGGTWNTIAGQPTDDSELALMLARSIVAARGYDREAAARAYSYWYRSHPYDIGGTTRSALGAVTDGDLQTGKAAERMAAAANQASQANGSLMRISPLGIWGHCLPADQLADLARSDSSLTHPNPVCQEACAVFIDAIARAIASGADASTVYRETLTWAEATGRETAVLTALREAADRPPADYQTHLGWVLVGLQNAFYQLLHAASLEEGVVATVMAGGDTDTNAAIAGALLGAVYGREAVPPQWRQMVLSCRPLRGIPGVHQPRPRPFWPVDALELAERLAIPYPPAPFPHARGKGE